MMANIYRTLLLRDRGDNFQVLHQRTSLTPMRKLWIAMLPRTAGSLMPALPRLASSVAGWAGLAGAIRSQHTAAGRVTLIRDGAAARRRARRVDVDTLALGQRGSTPDSVA
jgi:hypothetical protein